MGINTDWAQREETVTQIIHPNNLKEQPGQTKAVEQIWMVPAPFLTDQINKKQHWVVFSPGTAQQSENHLLPQSAKPRQKHRPCASISAFQD